MSDYVTLVITDPWYRFQYHDGDFDYGPTEAATEAGNRTYFTRGRRRLPPLGAWSKIYDVGFTKLSAVRSILLFL
jgi:phytoene desaturase